MKHTYKAAALLLSLLFCASCGSEAGDTTKETENTPTETAVQTEDLYIDNLPSDLDLGGYKVRILDGHSFSVEKEDGDIVNDTLYQRNREIEERLNCIIECLDYTGSTEPWNTFQDVVKSSIMAGTDDYDAVSGNLWWAGSLALQGMLTNLSDAPYLELDAEWWPTEYLDGFSYKGNCYWLTGPMELAWVSEKACMFYNEHLWNTLYEEDIYDTVDNGKFTFEFLNRIANEVYQDLNGNSKVDEDDRMGYAIKSDSNIDTYASGAGVVIAPFDSDGVPYLKFLDDMTRIEAFWEKFLQFKTNDNVLYIQWAGSDTTIINMELFREGNLMFVQGFLSHTTDQLRDMEDDYGVLPMPKLDETQENYLQIINNRVALFGIPVTVSDEGFNAVCAVFEAAAAEGYNTVIPSYYADALKNKYIRSEKSIEIINMLSQNPVCDFGLQYYDLGIAAFLKGLGNTSGIASTLKSQETTFRSKLESMLSALEGE